MEKHKKPSKAEDDLPPIMEEPLGLSKFNYTVIRTTMRNNIDLTAIADNKASMLLTLSSLLFTILIPVVLSNIEIIIDEVLYIPLLILALTCIVSIVMAALVTRPMKLSGQAFDMSGAKQFSPFFFGNYYKMSEASYKDYVEKQFKDSAMIKQYIISDMYHVGVGLGRKYSRIRRCYSVFIIGMLLTVLSAILVLAINYLPGS